MLQKRGYYLPFLFVVVLCAPSGCLYAPSYEYTAITSHGGHLYVLGHTEETGRSWVRQCVPTESRDMVCHEMFIQRGPYAAPSSGPPQTSPLLGAAVFDPVQLAANCERGDSTACVSLGLLFYAGEHVREDQGMACTLFREACDSGNEIGCGEYQLKCGRHY